MSIRILNEYPVVLTKDATWATRTKPKMMPGAILVLPKDAVLVIPPEVMSIETKDLEIVLPEDVSPPSEVPTDGDAPNPSETAKP